MKHIHFIGICGVGMSALAILWKKKGWKVTGSDVGFYPPISTHLQEHKIEFYPGWHPEKMRTPDLVVVGNVAGSENPERLKVNNEKIPHLSYPELISQNLIRKNSIVCAGTYGKTSTAALLSWILIKANFKPAYMFGGLCTNLSISAGDDGGDWSIMEGDEYKTSQDNLNAKFFSYKPTHLLLTGLSWDHLDVYPTEKSYYEAFEKLLAMIPPSGIVVTCTDDQNIQKLLSLNKPVAPLKTYGKTDKNDYCYNNILMNKNGIQFKIKHNLEIYSIKSPMLGEYMAENICGVFAMAKEIGIQPELIIEAIAEFKGIKRRLEKRGEINGAFIFDDIAHSPTKAKSALSTLKKIFTGKIYAIFEPNTGNRQINAAPQYNNAFNNADEVIIPRLTKIKIDTENKNAVLDGARLAKIISQTNQTTKYIENDKELINYLKEKLSSNDAVIFLGSHGFRGMIESLIN
ncbi:MAG: hypothetical protein COU29_03800 [Candidatus Magasanikbacteria bacterium CG10_big_fil_rev_8_21_14_0_10_36_32]|uniref:UDP-N-acetylmuramate:L-alanyl-gamma-D-glutamyl-meso-diaminopimelate ligase n=1 Tax=Candidatus Magasanikbacteria bacterium CG10_big_fil_rev_8_21_14_0_10_36_32 TaxID=1974646 RepID=A0A2M6W5M6_9BACT|nr:MAG: hypothetical protein COU29_03800 [Candidatus Magasanikbacteria bacterium CG10_big_fil_rev_8_21_14_0_10_36_32]